MGGDKGEKETKGQTEDAKERAHERDREEGRGAEGTERSLVREKHYSGAPGPSIIPIIASLPII